MFCLQCPAMYNIPCTTAQLLCVKLMENEWPSIIFSFSEKQQYVPVDFAYENCTQIISLLLETYKQLSLVNGSDEDQRMTSKKL